MVPVRFSAFLELGGDWLWEGCAEVFGPASCAEQSLLQVGWGCFRAWRCSQLNQARIEDSQVPLENLFQHLPTLPVEINCRWWALGVFILTFFFWENQVTKTLQWKLPQNGFASSSHVLARGVRWVRFFEKGNLKPFLASQHLQLTLKHLTEE